MKKILIMGLVAFGICATGCNKYLDVNDNPNYPKEVSIANVEPAVDLFLAEKVGYDLALVGSFWSQYIVQYSSSNQYYTIMTYNLTNSASNFTSPWSYFYGRVLPNIKVMLDKAKAEKKPNYELHANTMLAYTLYMLQSLYGQVAYTDAFCKPEYGTSAANATPKFDSEKDIYSSTLAILKKIYEQSINPAAYSEVATAEAIYVSEGSDMILGGDVDGWFGFANTLYLKLLLRDFEANKVQIQKVLENAAFLETDVAFSHFLDEADKSNPLYESDQRQLNTRKNIRACSDIIRIISESDPRLSVYYTGTSFSGVKYGLKGGSSTSQLKMTPTCPVYFATIDEVDFLQAEAYARLGDPDKAEEYYNAAIEACFNRLGCKGADDFLADEYAFDKDASAEGQVEQIICQKWASNVLCMPIESWFDINRTGYPAKSQSDMGTITDYKGVIGGYPVRFFYSKGSSDYNPNTPHVSSLTEKMWWHK